MQEHFSLHRVRVKITERASAPTPHGLNPMPLPHSPAARIPHQAGHRLHGHRLHGHTRLDTIWDSREGFAMESTQCVAWNHVIQIVQSCQEALHPNESVAGLTYQHLSAPISTYQHLSAPISIYQHLSAPIICGGADLLNKVCSIGNLPSPAQDGAGREHLAHSMVSCRHTA